MASRVVVMFSQQEGASGGEEEMVGKDGKSS